MTRFRRYQSVNQDHRGLDRATVIAQDRVLGGVCVLKYAAAGTTTAALLREEAALLSDLFHPRLLLLLDRFVSLEGLIEGEVVTGFATRWVDGPSLTDGLAGKPLEQKLRAFGELLDGVGYLHRRGVLHLDIKPANVLLAESGVVVLDLGSARPLDSGPGEAGGTLGYAAPEILAGQAASIAADLYSLGAVLYELLIGRKPFNVTDGPGLRRAVLAGDLVPIRALRPDIPRPLARLAEEMLSVDVPVRPKGIAEVRERLAHAGFSSPSEPGMPPLVGRSKALQELTALLTEQPGRQVCVVGQPGSGRTRLIRQALLQHADHAKRDSLNLSLADNPMRALQRLACINRPELPLPLSGPGWARAVSAGLRAKEGFSGPVFMGRREDHPPEALRTLDQLSRALEERNCSVLWASQAARPGAVCVSLAPLSTDAVTEIGWFYGVPTATQLGELVRGTGGWPGTVIRALLGSSDQPDVLAGDNAAVLRVLAMLPAGMPEAFIRSLPETLQEGVEALLSARIARWGEDGRLYLDRSAGEADPPEALQAHIVTVLRQQRGWADPLWTGLAAARLGLMELAESCFEGARQEASQRPSELEELCALLMAHGHREAQATLAFLRETTGDLSRAAELLSTLTDRSRTETLRLVRILRRARRFDEAEVLARSCLDGELASRFWLEVAFLCKLRKRLDEAEVACDEAERLEPELANGDSLTMRLRLVNARLEEGQVPPRMWELVERVEHQARRIEMPAAALAEAGIVLRVSGELARAEFILARAVRQADKEGDRRSAAGIRINHALVLRNLGRGREARSILRESIQIAEELGANDMLLHIRYNLAFLELSAGRLPSAQRYVDLFERDARSHPSREIRGRAVLLRTQLLMLEGEHEEALRRLQDAITEDMPASMRFSSSLYMSTCLLELDRPEEVLALIARTPLAGNELSQGLMRANKGRAHLALARKELALAREVVPDEPDPNHRTSAGAILLASAGEDLDPSSFARRRQDLDLAAKLLRGEQAAQAATLRDRMLMGPGADLEGIVSLTEAMREPQRFPMALARLVTEALGAHRVLIMMRIPGLGQQISYTELAGSEAAGIGAEVLRRIQKPDDYWLAADAFSDPRLRETSQTVRTFELKSLLAVAIPHGGKAVGALYVDDLYRAGRFGMDDVRVLQRLAHAVGDMLPLLNLGRRRQALVEPQDVLGVLLCDPGQVTNIENAVSMLRGQEQTNLMITGETGTGKSVLARRIAREVLGLSGVEVVVLRKGDPNLLVTQLVGSRRGEFTGALNQEGAIQRALRHRRALFLDEVQNLDEVGQQILLPLLELPRHFGGLTGTSIPLEHPLHVILGTNVEISQRRWAEHFREDLWYRMSAVHIDLPPLRERGAEAVYRYLSNMLEGEDAPAPEEAFETSALHRVTTWRWPGNLRQLHTFARRAAHQHMTSQQPVPQSALIRLGLVEEEIAVETFSTSVNEVDRARMEAMLDALRRTDWIQKKAAQELGMKPANFSKWLKRFGLREEVRLRRRLARGDTEGM